MSMFPTGPARRRVGLLLTGAALAAVLALPALGQDAPESLLPPGFGDPPPAGETPARPEPEQPSPENILPPATVPPAGFDLAPADEEAAQEDAEADEELALYQLPEALGRSLARAGPLTRQAGGFGELAFGTAAGGFHTRLMQAIRAPVASRWVSITLRRALLSHVVSPADIDPADWIAARAWLLLRMGESDAARLLVRTVDPDRYTPDMFSVALQTGLATSDPASLCPLADRAVTGSRENGWLLAQAMCAAFAGEPGTAGAIVDRVRTANRGRRTIDLLLAEKVVGAGVNGRRSITIEWDRVERLNAWRYGLATSTGVAVPDRLMATVGPQVRAWHARAPLFPVDQRLQYMRTAARLGVFSARALIDGYGALAETIDVEELPGSPAAMLAEAHAGDDAAARMAAMRRVWALNDAEDDRYVDRLLTAYAAARIRPDADFADDAPQLIGAMLAAGLDRQAARWAPVVADMSGSDAIAAWGLLAVGAPGEVVPIGAGTVADYVDDAGRSGAHRARLLVAALAGLGRLDPDDVARLAEELEIPLARRTRWSQAIGGAARAGQGGSVALLAAAGMQTLDWRNVPPAHLYHIVAALRQVGREPEARMIAAEALSRT